MHLNTSSRAKFFKIQFLDMKSNFCQRNKLQLKYFVQARFSNTGLFFWATRYILIRQKHFSADEATLPSQIVITGRGGKVFFSDPLGHTK